jgi:biopolymer transport protein ExbD
MGRSIWRDVGLVAAICVSLAIGGAVAHAADPPPAQKPSATDTPTPQKPVTLTINPDGTASWNGEPLPSEPALKDKLARQAQQVPKLELDLRFHSVGSLSDSNRQTLLDIVELTAKYGFVHVETTGDGATLTVLGPSATGAPTPK